MNLSRRAESHCWEEAQSNYHLFYLQYLTIQFNPYVFDEFLAFLHLGCSADQPLFLKKYESRIGDAHQNYTFGKLSVFQKILFNHWKTIYGCMKQWNTFKSMVDWEWQSHESNTVWHIIQIIFRQSNTNSFKTSNILNVSGTAMSQTRKTH